MEGVEAAGKQEINFLLAVLRAYLYDNRNEEIIAGTKTLRR